MRPELKRLITKHIRDDTLDYAEHHGTDYAHSDDYEMNRDMRRGVRGSGRRMRDRTDDAYDDERIKLSRKAKSTWKHKLINTDGTNGPHFRAEELYDAIDKMRLSYDGYDDSDICLIANMLYSDFGNTLKHVIPTDKEAYYYVALAKDFLEDDDGGIDGSEKVAAYYHFIVNG